METSQQNHDEIQFKFSQEGTEQYCYGPQAEMGCFRGGIGSPQGRCEAESTYVLHVKECINEWDGPLQRVPKLRGGISGLGSESFCISVLAVTWTKRVENCLKEQFTQKRNQSSCLIWSVTFSNCLPTAGLIFSSTMKMTIPLSSIPLLPARPDIWIYSPEEIWRVEEKRKDFHFTAAFGNKNKNKK